MLNNTFIHIPGIGPATEKQLWKTGIIEWKDIGMLSKSNLGPSKQHQIKKSITESSHYFRAHNANYFEKMLPASQHFRFFPEFRQSSVYLDIETTGLSTSSIITTIALYDGKNVKYFVQGKNLGCFIDEIQKYKVLITYNGRSFDIPFIENYFNTKLPHAQIDLRYILGHLGFKGGLKGCEKALGIDRKELAGVDGYFAVVLWNEYKSTGNPKILETLLAYNIEDVINLEILMVKAYNLHMKSKPFYKSHKIKIPDKVTNPMKADIDIIQALSCYR